MKTIQPLRRLLVSIVSGLSVLALSAGAIADPVEETIVLNESVVLPLGPNQVRFHFPPFDDAGGTLELQEVTIDVDITLSAFVTCENDSELPAPDMALTLAGFSETTVPVVAPINQTYSCTFPTDGSVTGTDGVPGSGPDFWDFGLVECAETDTVVITTDLDAFTGPDTFDIDIFVSGSSLVFGVDLFTIEVFAFAATCNVTVTLGFKTAAGACCLMQGGACDVLSEADCDSLGGVYQGPGTDCMTTTCPTVCPDLDGDDNVGFTDLIAVLASWGPCQGCPADFDGDGQVAFADLTRVLSAWGACPAP